MTNQNRQDKICTPSQQGVQAYEIYGLFTKEEVRVTKLKRIFVKKSHGKEEQSSPRGSRKAALISINLTTIFIISFPLFHN